MVNNFKREKEKGFIAVTSVLIIGALIVVLGVSIFHSSLTDQSMSSSYDSGQEALLLAEACVREGILRLKEDIGFVGYSFLEGEEGIRVGQNICNLIQVENISSNTKRISSLVRSGERAHFKEFQKELRYSVESTASDWNNYDVFDGVMVSDNSLVLEPVSAEGEIEGVVRTTETGAQWASNHSINNLSIIGDDLVISDNQTQGDRISNPISLNEVDRVADSEIRWNYLSPNLGSSLRLEEGTSDSVSINHSNELSISSNLTIELWIKLTEYHTGYARNFSKQTGTGDSNWNLYLFGDYLDNQGHGRIRFYANRGGSWGAISALTERLDLNKWYHVALDYDENLGGQLYINGIPYGSRTGSGSLALNEANASISLRTAVIDEVRIWNISRTEEQIRNNFGSELNGSESGLVAYWKFNEGSGASVSDSSQNNNTGTITGATWVDGIQTEVKVFTKIVDSEIAPTEPPIDWDEVINGGSIPGINVNDDLAGKWLWTKQELITNDPGFSPLMHSITEIISTTDLVYEPSSGYRISSILDISGENTVKNSQIFWQADTRKDDNIVIETNVHVGGTPLGWFEVQNGGSIPGLERGVDLSNISIKTRTTFNGGPDFYPKLNNINIFIEI